MSVDWRQLTVIHYPDPRLRQRCAAVTEFGDDLKGLAQRMFELMRQHEGVGLAAAQVGIPLRVFVMNATNNAADDFVFCNPEILEPHGAKEAEEGCLSIPDVRVQVRRATRCRIKAQDLAGKPIEREGAEFECRIWQHETDHLNGMLIIDRMGPGDAIAVRKTLRDMEAAFAPTKRPR